MNNILIKEFLLPPFFRITTKDIIISIEYHINNCYKNIDFILTQEKTISWNNFCQPLFEFNDRLEKVVSILDHLNSVKNNNDIRNCYEKILPMITNYYTFISQNSKLFKYYKHLKKNFFTKKFNSIQKESINKIIKDFTLSGVNLKEKQKTRYKNIVIKLSKLSLKYSNNVMDSSNSWQKLITNKKDIDGVSKYFLIESALRAKKENKKGWLLTLDSDSYCNIVKYCDNDQIRKEIYFAYNTRASDKFVSNEWDNSKIMLEILSLRKEMSNLLGFKSYAHKSLKNKMFTKPSEVIDFLKNLTNKVLKQAKKEINQLYDFVIKTYNIKKINAWDISYFSEKQKNVLYKINDEQIKKYFPEEKVIKGMFNIVKKIFGLKIEKRKNIEIWDQNVQFFDLFDNKEIYRGSFYLDLYTRRNKKNGAWMSVCSNMMKKQNGHLQKPIAYLVCNFSPPLKNIPSLLSHKEVVTLFHEFGHVLHHILTCIDISNISGINGVLWDAVEIPSQLMENWCWESEVLSSISGHYKNNEPLPNKIIKNILLSKKYNASLFILKQIEFGMFDFLLHYNFKDKTKDYILKTLYQVRKKYSLFHEPEWNRFPHIFSHIFSGGYAAGYYSYLWSHVLSSDIYSRFKKEGIFNLKTGLSFLNNFLSQGGSVHPMKLFINFMKRKPKIDSMLNFYNIR